MSMFKWEVVDPAAGRGRRASASGCLGQDGRARRPARRGHVRRHLRLPAGHGAGPQPRDHVLGYLHDPVPADLQATGCRATSAPAPRSSPASRRSAPRAATPPTSPARSWSPASCWPWSACWSTSPASALIHKVLPPAVTGAVVMLIGFNLAPVVAGIYWPQDQWVALLTATFMVLRRGAVPGLLVADRGVPRADLRLPDLVALRRGLRPDHLGAAGAAAEPIDARPRRPGPASRRPTGSASRAAQLADGVDVVHGPSFSLTFILLVLPGVIALIAENTGHVKAVAEMTGDDLDPYMGRAIGADGVATALASAFGGSPTTTYAENIGVMGATRVYSTAAYYVAAVVAILLGPVPEVRGDRERDPGRRARRHHGRALRHDRPGGRQDLGRERRRLRRPGQPGRPGRRHHRRHRRRHPRDHRRLRARRHRPRHDHGHRLLPHGQPGSPHGHGPRRRRGDAALESPL